MSVPGIDSDLILSLTNHKGKIDFNPLIKEKRS